MMFRDASTRYDQGLWSRYRVPTINAKRTREGERKIWRELICDRKCVSFLVVIVDYPPLYSPSRTLTMLLHEDHRHCLLLVYRLREWMKRETIHALSLVSCPTSYMTLCHRYQQSGKTRKNITFFATSTTDRITSSRRSMKNESLCLLRVMQ